MGIMSWKNEYAIGIEKFDNQHQLLFKMMDELNEAMKVGKGNSALISLVSEMEHYVQTHFADEETILDKYNYPRLNEHKAEHKKFVDEITKIKTDLSNHQIGLPVHVMKFLKDWLANHIDIKDRAYGSYLIGKGVV